MVLDYLAHDGPAEAKRPKNLIWLGTELFRHLMQSHLHPST